MSATTEGRRITLTLAWLSPVNPRSQLHRMARLTFEPPTAQLGVEHREADHHAARRGTVQHGVLEGRAALAFVAGHAVAVNVDCRIDSEKYDGQIRYGLALSVEMATTVRADVHAEVRQGLRAQVRSQQQIAPRA